MEIDYNSLLQPLGLPLLHQRILIAGPCSAESPEQLMQCAMRMQRVGMNCIFRAGVWKPRTSPGSFEGVGPDALEWLVEVRNATGMPVATEVASPLHVSDAVSAGIDVLWIGARTSANPFAMQALAETIGKMCPEKTVLVKNPINPDLELWLGAIKRLIREGVCHIGAIHRGFSVYKSNPFRNAPIWQIPLELHRRMPDLPLIHDPSHTGGTRDHIAPLSQQALDMGFSGLMIECHPAPDSALSDGGQQLTPESFSTLIKTLKFRDSAAPAAELEALRCQIDELDSELLSILARRMEVSRLIGEYKKETDMAVVQQDRYSRLLTDLLARGCKLGLDRSFLSDILETIHAESVRHQIEIINNSPARAK